MWPVASDQLQTSGDTTIGAPVQPTAEDVLSDDDDKHNDDGGQQYA